MAVQLVLQTPFTVTVNTLPVTSALESMSKRRHAMEPTFYRFATGWVHDRHAKLFGKGLDNALSEHANEFDTKLKTLFPRLFSSDSACMSLRDGAVA
jgi:hypothetical protein